MSQGTINLRFRLCSYDLIRVGREASLSIVELSIALRSLFTDRPRRARRREEERLTALRDLAERDPHLHVEVRTGADGVTRVFARRLGDWGCNCEIHLERRRRMCAVVDQAVEMTKSFDRAMQSVTRDATTGPEAIRALEAQALKLAGDDADGDSKGGPCGDPGDVVSGESDPGIPGGFPGIASPDPSTAGDGAAGQARAGCGPEEVQRRLGRSPDTANEGRTK